MASIGAVIERESWPRWHGWRATRAAACALGLVGVLVLAGCGAESGPESPPPPSGPAGAVAPAPSPNCTAKADDAASLGKALGAASSGDVICVSGDLGDTRLQITQGGSAEAPVTVRGDGKTAVNGITVEADNVVVDGFTADQPKAPGASLKGNNITLRDSTINDPQKGDNDGIRFWGDDIKILHNTVTDTQNTNGSHADCMQTFATDSDSPASHNVLIDSNRCEEIDNNCLIAEGPNSSAGDGSGDGESKNITFSNNYCDNRASQAVMVDDVQGMTVVGNDITSRINHAFAFQNNATGAVVQDNKIGGNIKFEVGMDDTSEPGYQGPRVGGAP
jgi:hypothetical protein